MILIRVGGQFGSAGRFVLCNPDSSTDLAIILLPISGFPYPTSRSSSAKVDATADSPFRNDIVIASSATC